jgi:5'-nucleotidase (lipoprotein e(P4) family)
MKRLLALALVGLLAACAAPPTPPPQTAPPAQTLAQGAGGFVPSLAVRWVRDSAEYRAATLQTYRLATAELERLAGVLRPGRWAVVLDADETVISNAAYEVEREAHPAADEDASWKAWVERHAAPPVPGAGAFLAAVHRLGGKIAIVTNRAEKYCPDTEEDFRRHAIPFDVMLCKPADAGSSKQPRWDRVAHGTAARGLPPLEIVMYLGDNIRDFPGLDQDVRKGPESAFEKFGSVYFLLPNPIYGSWERNRD